MKKIVGWLILPFLLIVVNCTVEPEIVTEFVPVVVESPVLAQDDQALSYAKIQEDLMQLKPIKNYQTFFVEESGRVFGIIGDNIEQVTIKDTDDNSVTPEWFGIVDGKVMIAIKHTEQGDPISNTEPVEYETVEVWDYFEQTDNIMNRIENFPLFEEAQPVEIVSEPFKIENSMSADIPISKVYKESAYVSYLPVTGAHVVESGLWYNVSETYAIREAGLYFWPVEGNPIHVLTKGRLW